MTGRFFEITNTVARLTLRRAAAIDDGTSATPPP